jgi:3-oxoacyl-[acyl-carrier protein] reductase
VFAREGADVAFNYGSRDDLAEEVKKKVEAFGRRAHSFKVSVTDRFGLKHLTRELVAEWGGLDILVNNAAINRGDNFATTTDRAWDEVIGVNVGSLFAVTKPIYKQMIRQRAGAILNITSIGAIRALPTAVHYATSKAAMIGFTKCLSREAGTFGIKVNAIAAGIFDTDLAQALPERWLQMHDFWTSSGRLGRPPPRRPPRPDAEAPRNRPQLPPSAASSPSRYPPRPCWQPRVSRVTSILTALPSSPTGTPSFWLIFKTKPATPFGMRLSARGFPSNLPSRPT